LVVAHSDGLRVLLADGVDLGSGDDLGELVSTLDNVEVRASGVVLVLAAHGAFGLHGSGPAPDPVDCESLADLRVGRHEEVALAPLFELGGWLAGCVVAVGHLSVDRGR
jgi:hypothetical protein